MIENIPLENVFRVPALGRSNRCNCSIDMPALPPPPGDMTAEALDEVYGRVLDGSE
jgi:hypothetical protein